MTLRAVSYGGGVQSTALLVLAAQGRIDFPTFLFANVGDDSEHPDTIDYVHDIAIPYGHAFGIEVHELRKVPRAGSPATLYEQLTRKGSRSIQIPVRMANGAPGHRGCTQTFKIAVIAKWLKANGASKDTPATVGIGFSTDEMHRTGNRAPTDYDVPVYPLLDLGLDRAACQALIARAGLPVPPKSACWFCPFHKPVTFREQKRARPDLHEKAVALEDLLNERRDMLGKDHVYFTRFGKRLAEVCEGTQGSLLDDGPESCDDGYCWT